MTRRATETAAPAPASAWSVLAIVAVYGGCASLWILVTDLLAAHAFTNGAPPGGPPPSLAIAKGLLFVAVTSVLLYALLQRFAARVRCREASLREEQTRLRSLVDSIPDPVWLKDLEGVYRLCNAASYRAFGFGREADVLGKTDLDLLPSAIAARAMAEDARVLESGRPLTADHPRWPRTDDPNARFETVKTPMLDADGRRFGILAIARDITAQFEARRQSEERARLQDQLARVVDSVPGVVCSFRLRADGFVMLPFASKAIYALYGLDPADLVRDASALNRHVHPDDFTALRASLLESARTLSPWRHEWRYLHPERGLIWLEGNCTPQTEPEGSVLWHGFVQDVTPRKIDEEYRALILGLTGDFLPGGRSEPDLARLLFERIGPRLGADACFNHRFDPATRRLTLVHSAGMAGELFGRVESLEPDDGLCGLVARDGQPLAADRERICADARAATVRALGFTAYACCPLLDPAGRILGTFSLASRTREEFKREELELLQTATQSLALAWQRLMSERQLAASESRLAAVVGSAMDAIISVDSAQRIVLFNQAAERMFGACSADVLGTPLDRFLPEAARGHHTEHMASFRHTGVTNRRVGRLGRLSGLRANGAEFPIEASISHADAQGEPLLTVILRDVTEREEAARALAASQDRLIRLASNLPDGAVYELLQGPAGEVRFLYVSLGIERITGIRVDDLMRDPGHLKRIMHPEDRATLVRPASPVADGAILDFTVRVLVGERIRSMHIRSSPRTLGDGSRLWDGVILDVTDRIQATEALRDSDRRVVLALEAAGHGVFDWNGAAGGDGEVFYSKAWKRILGYAEDEIASTTDEWYGRVHPEDLGPCMSEIQRHLDGLTPSYHAEFRMRTRDGRYKWVLNQGTVVSRDAAGNAQRMLGTLTDVSRRHEIEERLRASESTLVEAQALALVGSWRLDCLSGAFVWSEEMRRLLGLTADAAPTLEALLGAVHPDERAMVSQAWQAALAGTPYNLQHRVVVGAETRWIRARGRFQLDSTGRAVAGVGTLLDITERMAMLESLERHQQHLEELVAERTQQLEKANRSLSAQAQAIADLYNRAPCGYHSLDADGTFVAINDTELGWLGYERDEVLDRMRLTEVLSAASRQRYDECFARLLREGSVNDVDYELVRRDGSLLPVTLSSTIVCGPDGQFLWTRSTLFDNTERRRREHEIEALNAELARRAHDAEAANRAKSAFLANMSHEIRTPMNAILGFTDLLGRHSRDAAERARLQQVGEAARHLLSIIDDILDLSKIEAGKLTLASADFDLDDLVRRTCALFAERAEAKGLELTLDLPAGAFRVHGDATRLRQVLLNYLSNAVKFTDHGGVTVRLRNVGETAAAVSVRLEVEDSGIGIAVLDQSRLFEPFEQADASTTRRFGGTGLGLAINRRLASLMGGDVGLRSEPGAGSCFWVEVRLERAQPLQIPRAASAAALEGLSVLLVDAEPASCVTYRAQLESLGLRVAALSGPACGEALTLARQAERQGHPFIAAILVPGSAAEPASEAVDVLTIARRLRALPLARRIPSLLLIPRGQEAAADSDAVDARLAEAVAVGQLEATLRQIARIDSGPDSAAMLRDEERLRADHRGARILVAEDNPLNQQVTGDLLQSVGLEYDVACDGTQAVDAATRRAYDLILMDIQMPVLNGLEATTAIRGLPGYETTPIIAMTADGFDTDRTRSRDVGMDDVLIKPVAAESFYATLVRWLDRRAEPYGTAEIAQTGDGYRATPPAEGESLSTAIYGLPGIDAAIGLKFARGKLPVYLELLQMFADPAHVGEGGLTRSAEAGDLTQLRQRAHALKGVAALIGATTVQSLAIDVESAIRSKAPADEVLRAASRVDGEFTVLAAAIRNLPPVQPLGDAPPPETASDPKAARALIERLDEALTNGDFAAYELVERHGPTLRALLGREAAVVERHVAAFAFEAARAALRNARYSSLA